MALRRTRDKVWRMFARASVAEAAHAPEGTFGPRHGPYGLVRRAGRTAGWLRTAVA